MKTNVRLLLICSPAPYPKKIAETPELYQRLAAEPRIELYHADPEWFDGSCHVGCVEVPADLTYSAFQKLSASPKCVRPLSEFDLAFCRTLKPFPPGYMDRLVAAESVLLFVNSPRGIVRHLQPGFLPSIAGQFLVDTCVTADLEQALRFLHTHNTIVAKRANSCGGKGVYKIGSSAHGPTTENLLTGRVQHRTPRHALQHVMATSDQPFQFVRFVTGIHHGDKRILVVDGEVLGAYLRKGAAGDWIHNVSSGGSYCPAQITDSERLAIEQTWPAYRALGVHTLGYDFLMDEGEWRISEINAGNIAGYSLLEELERRPIYRGLIDWLVEFGRSRGAHPGFIAEFAI